MTTIRSFKVDPQFIATLTIGEKRMLPILTSAAKIIDKVFLLQENDLNNGANFYPRDAIKEEILQASQKNPIILSPFTIVKRNKTKKLTATHYHTEYKVHLKQVARLLKKAAKISENKSFKEYLEITANVLAFGDYRKMDKAWINVKNNTLDIIIGPFERYLDKLFFVKKTYQSCVCIVDHKKSQEASLIRDILYASVGPNIRRVISPSKPDIQVRKSLIFSGFLGRALFTQQHLPSDTESVERFGSRILVYDTCLDYKFAKLIFPIFQNVFEKSFRERYTREIIKAGCYYHVLLSGIVQHLHRYRGSRTRLKELFPILDEANTAASGIQHAKHLVLKGVMDQKELEAMMIAQICWGFSEMVMAKKTKSRDVYLKGDAMIFNFLMRENALLEKDGISWPNFAKMFFAMESISTIFTELLEEGTYNEAKDFLNKYVSTEYIESFRVKLARIEPL